MRLQRALRELNLSAVLAFRHRTSLSTKKNGDLLWTQIFHDLAEAEKIIAFYWQLRSYFKDVNINAISLDLYLRLAGKNPRILAALEWDNFPLLRGPLYVTYVAQLLALTDNVSMYKKSGVDFSCLPLTPRIWRYEIERGRLVRATDYMAMRATDEVLLPPIPNRPDLQKLAVSTGRRKPILAYECLSPGQGTSMYIEIYLSRRISGQTIWGFLTHDSEGRLITNVWETRDQYVLREEVRPIYWSYHKLTFPASLLALSQLCGEGYWLTKDGDLARFIRIMTVLPVDLQRVIVNRAYGLARNNITDMDFRCGLVLWLGAD